MKYLYDSYNMVCFVKKKAGKQTVKVMEFRERIKCEGKKDKQPPPQKKTRTRKNKTTVPSEKGKKLNPHHSPKSSNNKNLVQIGFPHRSILLRIRPELAKRFQRSILHV
mmetsp:Transcript_40234/g.58819  ORF Transcript_40234/g.58819 Transcript_40234/m.58819 type:complete len:109 (+) Transcript_40234:1133-1459(+)